MDAFRTGTHTRIAAGRLAARTTAVEGPGLRWMMAVALAASGQVVVQGEWQAAAWHASESGTIP